MRRNRAIFCVLLLTVFLGFLASLCLGASGLSPRDVLGALLDADRESPASRIFWYVRLPRALAAVLAGAALSTAGMLLQSVLRNPLAAPSVIGINSGAGLCALICMAFFPSFPRLIPFAAFLGACLAAFSVYLLARLTGASRATIVLSGVAVNAIFGAVMDAIVTLIPDAITGRSAFSIGGFANTTLAQLGFAAPLCALALLTALLFGRELGVMDLPHRGGDAGGLRGELRGAFELRRPDRAPPGAAALPAGGASAHAHRGADRRSAVPGVRSARAAAVRALRTASGRGAVAAGRAVLPLPATDSPQAEPPRRDVRGCEDACV